MFRVDGTNVYLTRGDSLMLQIGMKRDGEAYTPQTGENVRFAMKAKYTDPDENVLIVKDIPLDTMILEILPEDTKSLKFNKTYVYDIQYTDLQGHVDTFILGNFTLTEEVL